MSKNKRKTKVKKPAEGGAARKEADAPRSQMVVGMILNTKGHVFKDGPRRSKDARREREAFEEGGGNE